MPAFGAANTRNMFVGMKDICDQLMLKWQRYHLRNEATRSLLNRWYSRFGSDHDIDPADDFTRLTFDTIGLCSMSYRWGFLLLRIIYAKNHLSLTHWIRQV